jgi:hypothetical protein
MSKVVKTLAVSKNVRESLREQDRIVKYIVSGTKQMSMNFIVTRPNTDALIWNRPSRKKLAASKSVRSHPVVQWKNQPLIGFGIAYSHNPLLACLFFSWHSQQPGPFPITNVDLAEFTLGALRMEKLYNSCPYVVQDGI